ncbi:MAG: hypothetical protein K8R53_01870, partial [Bacteroidales bacterium]|nr:hypothetical protein [Bacteroidales bacterium]
PATPTTLPLVCFGSCDPCQTVVYADITFRVDMSNETVNPLGVHIAGSFQGWDPAGSPMTDIGNDIYELTFTLQEGAYHEYKFVNGNDWGMEETVPAYCNNNSNRYITVPGTDSTLMSVCYGSCNICNPPQHDITFRVDMTYETVAMEGVHIAGSFQGWDPAASLMTDIGNNLYEITFTLGEGDYHEYKFINGADWAGEESVPPACNMNNNRYIVIPAGATTLPDVCFSSCDPCPVLSFDVDLTVYLEGPFYGMDMNTALNTNGYIPITQPFNVPPWNYMGPEQADPIPNVDVVDWVLVELRETTGGPETANPTTIIAQQAGLILKDGKVVNTDGAGMLNFIGTINDNLFAVVWHRNHLGVMSNIPLVAVAGVYAFDYTTGENQVYGGINGHKEIAVGIWGLVGADGSGDGQVNNADKVEVWTPQAGNAGYETGDFNMDGNVSNQDKVDVWEPNGGRSAQVPLLDLK